jgi:asparagine synthase (glutamine-hydrolysing)
MCGINGILSENSMISEKIVQLNGLLRHRGPDDEGYVCLNTRTNEYSAYSGDDSVEPIKRKFPHISTANFKTFNIVLGHRRLSIIDISENGHCPMSDEDGQVWITYNGEIYNYIELRNELKSEGYFFKTQSDTEVIVKSYLKWGEECFKHFNGMWAMAIWDAKKNNLILSKDRFGVKPLYYLNSPDLFAFSSEIKPLLCLTSADQKINDKKIPFFVLYGNRLSTEDTYLKNINSLKPSHYLVYANGSAILKKYYEIPTYINKPKTESQLKEELVELFTDSVRLRFRSDVPVGTCLSGGMDSSSIAAISNKLFGSRLNTFSAVWKQYPECDETIYIDKVNETFGCNENKVEPDPTEFETVFEKLAYYQEIPTEGPGLYPQWYVMQKAKEKVKVLLDGQGGDEVFGGYFGIGTYLRSLIKDKRRREFFKNLNLFLSFVNKDGIHSFTSWLFPGFYNRVVRGHFSEKYKIFNKDIISNIKKKDLYFDVAPPEIEGEYFNNLSRHFITKLTIPTLLHYEDRSSMAHSIESRVPFLDYRLVEFGVNLPPHYLFDKNNTRPLFRKAFENYLPELIAKRKDKLGYPVPFDKWTRNELKEFVNESLTNQNAAVYNYLNQDIVKKNLLRHYKREIDYGWEIWRLLSLEKFLTIDKMVKQKLNEFSKTRTY